jgi:hypothetical protein
MFESKGTPRLVGAVGGQLEAPCPARGSCTTAGPEKVAMKAKKIFIVNRLKLNKPVFPD